MYFPAHDTVKAHFLFPRHTSLNFKVRKERTWGDSRKWKEEKNGETCCMKGDKMTDYNGRPKKNASSNKI